MASPAQAQWGGWGGWGGSSTLAEGYGRGFGVAAAGAGQYNVDTAQARSINANTAMQVNQYMYEVNKQNAKEYYARSRQKQQEQSATGVEIYQRLRDNPSTADVHSGDALNVVMDDLTSPMVLGNTIQHASQQIPSELVKNIVFAYTPNMIAISLEDLTAKGAPDVLKTSPAFETERKAVRAAVAQARKEAQAGGPITPETLATCQNAVKALQARVAAALPQGSPDRKASDNFLKALFGLTKMLETPGIETFLKDLNKIPTTTLGHLIGFMHTFNLRFGVADAPAQQAAYDQLFPMLVALRSDVQAPESNPYAQQGSLGNPQAISRYFSGAPQSNGAAPQPKPGAAPPPPPPGQP
jgi:hypothetical protein